MATILTKKSDTASAVPLAADLTNAAGGAELAVNATDKRLFSKTSGGSVVELGTNPSSLTMPNGTANGLAFLNASKVVTSGSALVFDGTNLGVGVSPASDGAIHVHRAGASFPTIKITNGTTGTGNLDGFDLICGSGGEAYVYNRENQPILFGVNNSEQMRLTSTGLGIGTSSPAVKLDVNGVGGALSAVNPPLQVWDTTALAANVGGGIAFGGNYTGSTKTNWAGIAGLKENATDNNYSGYMAFYTRTNGSGNAERMRLDSSGNLGLGVTPSAWRSTEKAVQIGSGALHSYQSAGINVSSNAYINSSNQDIYVVNGFANRYLQAVGNGQHIWYNAPSGTAGNAITFTQAMTLDASGKLLLGTTNATTNLTIGNGGGGNDLGVLLSRGATTNFYQAYDGTKTYIGGVDSSNDYVKIGSLSSHPVGFVTGNSERARIDTSGNLLVGTTSRLQSDNRVSIQGPASNGGEAVVTIYNTVSSTSGDASPALVCSKDSVTTTSSQRFIQFYAGGVSTTPMGGIVGNGASNVQFATLSDAREKTNIQLINGSLEKIVALKPVEFDWILNGEHCPAGFVAQDVEQVFPEFVIENMANEGQESRKGLTGGMTGGIIPHLVKAIQEQQAIIESLKARLDAANL